MEWPSNLPALPTGIRLVSANLNDLQCFEVKWEDEFTKKTVRAIGGKQDTIESVYKMCEWPILTEFCYLRAASLKTQNKISPTNDEIESHRKLGIDGIRQCIMSMEK